MKFTVRQEFQVLGINYEVGNTHIKHQLDDARVMALHAACLISVDGFADAVTPSVNAPIQPHDMIIDTRGIER